MNLPLTLSGVVVLLVNLDLVRQPRDVRHVDLDRPVAQGLHELVVLQPAVFRFVGVADDDFVDICLREFLRFDLVFLAGTQQIVQKRDIQFEDFDEFNQPAIGDVELAVKIERPRIAVGPVFGDLAVIDVAGQFRRVLVFFVLRLKGADSHAVLFAERKPLDAHVLNQASPVAIVSAEPLAVLEPAVRAQFALDRKRRRDPHRGPDSSRLRPGREIAVESGAAAPRSSGTTRSPRPNGTSPTCTALLHRSVNSVPGPLSAAAQSCSCCCPPGPWSRRTRRSMP